MVCTITTYSMKGDARMEFLLILLYLLPVFAVLALLNALFRIAWALESIAQSMKTMEKDKVE
jgi:hypothetical protein